MSSYTPEYTFSQNRGTLHMAVGRTSLIVFWISCGRRFTQSVQPMAMHQ